MAVPAVWTVLWLPAALKGSTCSPWGDGRNQDLFASMLGRVRTAGYMRTKCLVFLEPPTSSPCTQGPGGPLLCIIIVLESIRETPVSLSNATPCFLLLPSSSPYLDSPGHIFLSHPTVSMESAAVYFSGQTFSPDYSNLASGSWLLPGSRKHVLIFGVLNAAGLADAQHKLSEPVM